MSEVNGNTKIALPSGWEWKTLNDIGIPSNSSILPYKYGNEIFEVWSVPNFDKDEPEYLKGSEIGSNKIFVQEGDILLCKINPRINRVWKVRQAKGFKQIASTEWIVVRSKELNSSFLLYQLQSQRIRNELLKNVSGVGGSLMRARPNAVKELKLSVPSKPIQDNIVSKIEELFSELDKSIEQLKTTQQQLKVYRQSVLNYAFERKGMCKQLSEITDKIQIGPFGSQLHKEDYIENGIPLINPMHIENGKIVPDTSYSIRKSKRDSLPNYILQTGDIIMGRRGEMGRCGLVTSKENGWFCGTGSLIVRPNQKVVDSTFLFYQLRSESVKKYLEDNAAGTTMTNLNSKIVNSIPVNVPSLKEQESTVQEIESRLSVADQLEETIANSLQQAEALRQSILKKAFEGKLISA